MKTLTYTVNGSLKVGDTGVEAAVGDQIKLYLDTEANPEFPEFITGTIQHPIVSIQCNTKTSYRVEYNESDLLGASSLLIQDDVVDAEIITGLQALIDALGTAAYEDVEVFATAAQGALADTAVQPADLASGTITPKDGDLNLNEIGVILTGTAEEGPPRFESGFCIQGVSLDYDGNSVGVLTIYESGTQNDKAAFVSNSPNWDEGISWSGTEWLIFIGRNDEASFSSNEDVATPDLVTTWVARGGASGTPTFASTEGVSASYVGQSFIVGSIDPVIYSALNPTDLGEWTLTGPSGVIADPENAGFSYRKITMEGLALTTVTYVPAD